MRILLGQLAPVRGDVPANVAKLRRSLEDFTGDLAVFPEMFLTGYAIGDRVHRLRLTAGHRVLRELAELAEERQTTIAVGAPYGPEEHPGEVENAVLVVGPDGTVNRQTKRYLPTFGPFEEGIHFTASERSTPIPVGGRSVGFSICYDAFFPEVARDLAQQSAALWVVLSAAPVTSRRYFATVLPARALENATPTVYVNRVGVEDGFVFGGGSGAWNARGEPLELTDPIVGGAADEWTATAEVDLDEGPRWRPFRPFLRDTRNRPTPGDRPDVGSA
ncbi:MAG: carbon-nitrogen hydrolase family protein [Thermoplasmata archaeon]|nr:carbon-nitrogen hydrolase family protein [Thermoplasmata archaeon]